MDLLPFEQRNAAQGINLNLQIQLFKRGNFLSSLFTILLHYTRLVHCHLWNLGSLGTFLSLSILESRNWKHGQCHFGFGMSMEKLPGSSPSPVPMSGCKLLGSFQLTQIIGAGGFGIAIRGKRIHTGSEVAIKVIPLNVDNSKWGAKELKNEVGIISRIPKHPNVVEYFSCWKQQLNQAQLTHVKSLIGKTLKLSIPANLPSVDLICIEMELCTCNLRTWLKTRSTSGGMNPRKSYRVFLQLVDGLEHIHANNLIHRDLKPTNILISASGTSPNVKIADFGLAVLHSQGGELDYHTTNVGNALYKAPEQESNKYGKAVDIYALGLILYELFDPTAQVNVGESVTFLKYNQKLPPDLQLVKEYPLVAKLILEMIKYSPEERPSFAKIREQIICSRNKSQSESLSDAGGDDDNDDETEKLSLLISKLELEDCLEEGGGGTGRQHKQCSGCGGPLTSPRYKCGVCANIVLCKYCEYGTTTKNPGAQNLAFLGHSTLNDHPMIKLKTTAEFPPGKPCPPPTDKNGCKHYRRKCQLHCLTCNEYFWCRFCHDEARGHDHKFDRTQVGLIKCSMCSTPQIVVNVCRKCGITFAKYFCPLCHLYDDSKNVLQLAWHCSKCGICRKKPSPDLAYDHCNGCGMCYQISSTSSHQCKPNAGKSTCPICKKGVFDSKAPSVLVNGEYVHVECLKSRSAQAAAC